MVKKTKETVATTGAMLKYFSICWFHHQGGNMNRILLGLIMLLTVSTNAMAQSKDGDGAAESPAAPEETSEYTYEGLLAMGHGKYVSQDSAGAKEYYEQARLKNPARPEAYYYLGCALKAEGNFIEAVNILASAATVAGEEHPEMNARALFLIAITWEAAMDLEKAKYAWIQYKAFAKLHPENNPLIHIADAHITAIDDRSQQISEYAKVTDRIAANGKQ
jgi:tetratricopeptide (TPR) repeat protein